VAWCPSHLSVLPFRAFVFFSFLCSLCEADVKTWMIGKHDIELVDFLIRLKDELVIFFLSFSLSFFFLPDSESASFLQKSPRLFEYVDHQQAATLEKHVQVIIDGLPDDLRASILQPGEQNGPEKVGE